MIGGVLLVWLTATMVLAIPAATLAPALRTLMIVRKGTRQELAPTLHDARDSRGSVKELQAKPGPTSGGASGRIALGLEFAKGAGHLLPRRWTPRHCAPEGFDRDGAEFPGTTHPDPHTGFSPGSRAIPERCAPASRPGARPRAASGSACGSLIRSPRARPGCFPGSARAAARRGSESVRSTREAAWRLTGRGAPSPSGERGALDSKGRSGGPTAVPPVEGGWTARRVRGREPQGPARPPGRL